MSQEDPNQVGFLRLMMSELGERLGLNRRAGGDSGRRNMDEILRRKTNLEYKDFAARYDRKDIAGRIVDAWPDATWRKKPIITEDEEADDTPFEKAWTELEKRLRCLHYFTRADKLAGLGRYAVILIGVKGGTALSTALTQNQFKEPSSVIYLSVFSEQHAKVRTWVSNPRDARFGQPETYSIDLSSNVEGFTGVGTQEVHWSRIIHVAEDLLENEVFGRPRLERVFNLLEDLEKVVSGAAEMFYLGADRGLHADIRDDFKVDDKDREAMKQQLEEYSEGLRRILRTRGVDINTIGGTVVDPSGAADKVLDLIAGTTGIPKRILIGSERGELASSQDETNFNGRVQERREDHAEPTILRPFIDRLIWLGAFTEPKDGYTVEWPSLFELSDSEKVTIVKDLATAARMMPGLVTPGEVREGYLGLEYELPKEKEDDDGNKDGDKDDGKTDDETTDGEEGVTRTVKDLVTEEEEL